MKLPQSVPMKKLADVLEKIKEDEIQRLRNVKPVWRDYGDDIRDYERKRDVAWSKECEKYQW